MKAQKILLIEDDLEMQSLLTAYLIQSKYEVIATASPIEAINLVEKGREIDLIILDLTLPEMDGFAACKKLRKLTQVPIIISSARGDVYNKVEAFDMGADDYLAKSYEPVELLARINALLRRIKTRNLNFGPLSILVDERSVRIDDKEIELTASEFDILLFLVENRKKPMSREQIANSVNAVSEESTLRSIDTHIRNLRLKLNDSAKDPKYIESVWGIGYKFCI